MTAASERAFPCRWCSSALPAPVLDLGEQPAADDFPLPSQSAAAARHPLQMAVCTTCGLAQLVDDPTVPDEPRALEPQALVDQAQDAVARIAAAGLLDGHPRFVEFDSPHGGSWRSLLAARGGTECTDEADVVVDVFSLMHEADQRRGLTDRVDRLAPGGRLLLQFHPLTAIVEFGQWNALRHGHMAYYSVSAVAGMLADLGLTPQTAWTFGLYGRTVLLAAARGGEPDETVRALLADEHRREATGSAFAAGLQQALTDTVDSLRGWLDAARRDGVTVGGYAAASRAVPLLNAADIGPDRLPWVADGSPAKWGRAIPGVGVPIVPVEQLRTAPPDRVLLFVPDLLDEVRAAIPEVERSGGRWVIAEPSPRVFEPPSFTAV